MTKNLVSAQKLFTEFYLYYMLDNVASYHCLQFHGKLKNQTWENGKKTTWLQDWFWPLRPKFGPQNFFHGLYLYCMFDIVSSYHCMQLQEKLMNQTWENDEKPSFGPKLFTEFYLYYMLDNVASYHCMQFQGKLREQQKT